MMQYLAARWIMFINNNKTNATPILLFFQTTLSESVSVRFPDSPKELQKTFRAVGHRVNRINVV